MARKLRLSLLGLLQAAAAHGIAVEWGGGGRHGLQRVCRGMLPCHHDAAACLCFIKPSNDFVP